MTEKDEKDPNNKNNADAVEEECTAETETEEEKAEPSRKEKKAEESKLKKENTMLKNEAEKLAKSLEETTDKYLRLVAEYDNFRKRTQKEKEAIYTDACADCITTILPIADNLERALQFPDGANVIDGVKMTMSELKKAFEKLGIEEIETKTFDPNLHNAVMHEDDGDRGEGEITDVFQKGYKKGDKVIRHAMVKVVN